MRRRVVVTGVGVVSPLGSSLDAIASAVAGARSGVATLSLFDGTGMATTAVGQVADFDLAAWRERVPALAADYDRKVFFALAAGRDAVAAAGLAHRPDLRARMGLNLGTSLESFLVEQLLNECPGPFQVPRFVAAWLARPRDGRQLLQTPLDRPGLLLASDQGLGGPSWTNCSACASGTQALGHSLRLVRQGRLDLILAGGTDSMLNPLGLGGFSVLGALAPAGDDPPRACRPFDRSRGGTVLGEGAALFVVEALDHALARGARPLAELVGYGASLDAYRVSDPCPDGRGAAQAMQSALDDARLGPDDVDYVSAHGTGTVKNDPMESRAIETVLGAERARAIPVSSLKSAMGHLIGASGPVELAVVLAALGRGLVPATLHLTHPDPECPLDYVPLSPRPATVRVFLKNSFGLGGQNASLVVRTWEDDIS